MRPARHRCAALFAAALLAACGGGEVEDTQVVTGIEVQRLSYGQFSEIVLVGAGLRADMTVNTGICPNASFRADSTPKTAFISCRVAAVGEQPLTITGSRGQVVLQTTVKVPLPQVTLFTSQGNVAFELDPVAAPNTVNNFLGYVSRRYYSATLFHRVIRGFVVQGGGYTTGMAKKDGQQAPIALESKNGLSNLRATVAMARNEAPDTATSEFYVNVADNKFLDFSSTSSPGYAVFGTVVQGMEVIDAIATAPTGLVNGFRDVPLSDVTVNFALQTR